MKLFRLRSQHSNKSISEIIYRTNEERAEFFKEINPGQRYLQDATLVDNCTSASNYIEKSEYGKLVARQEVTFPKIALASFVIPGDYRTTEALSLSLASGDNNLSVYVRDITQGQYTKPQLYIRFDYPSSVVTLPTAGAVYTSSDSGLGNTQLTVVEIRPGEGDGDAAGYILFSGVTQDSSISDDGTGTLTKVSGTGDSTIPYSYKSVGYRASEIEDRRLGGWRQLSANTDGAYDISPEYFMGCVFGDRVDFLLVGSGSSFTLTDIELTWCGVPNKAYHREKVSFIPNLGRDGTELIANPTFGTAGTTDANWNVTPQSAADNCYPTGCSSLVEVSSNASISTSVSGSQLGMSEAYGRGKAVLEIWARYFPPIYTDGSGEQITEDSYDYAKLMVKIRRAGRGDAETVTLSERVNTHWKVVQLPICLTGKMGSGDLGIEILSDKTLQIARVSLKRIPA